MSFITTKFHAILCSGFSGVVLTNCFSIIFHFRQKGALLPEKKIESECPVDMHIYTLCPSLIQSFRKKLLSGFREIALTNCFCSIFHFRQKVKKERNSEKKMESKFPVDMHIFTLCPS